MVVVAHGRAKEVLVRTVSVKICRCLTASFADPCDSRWNSKFQVKDRRRRAPLRRQLDSLPMNLLLALLLQEQLLFEYLV